ncbi:MAG: hypothetical protein LBJ12_00345 [Oscillospiraceae bacterium]|nr:hypothetical protein [Oscillospiraceae bacterium]
MKHTHHTKRLLAVLLAVLALLPIGMVAAQAAPLLGVELDCYVGTDSAEFSARTFPRADNLDDDVSYKWTLLDSADQEITPDCYGIFSGYFYVYNLVPGDYTIVVKVTVDNITVDTQQAFTLTGNDDDDEYPDYLSIDLLYDAVHAYSRSYGDSYYSEADNLLSWRYSTESWNAYIKADDAAIALWEKVWYDENFDGVTQAQLDDTATALINAFHNLKSKNVFTEMLFKVFNFFRQIYWAGDDINEWIWHPFWVLVSLLDGSYWK